MGGDGVTERKRDGTGYRKRRGSFMNLMAAGNIFLLSSVVKYNITVTYYFRDRIQ